ncbi:hypothetical protein WN55_01282 [Dufourea novaeangliae]|uniref:Uncharacterized protein n=1 Tax=Dufourea novaeangliae TaxID=178035 RepID=A0A154NWR1_DUFNO|nr:hypothetical protein WN55_01282 [Dufourea novaeangliae]
MKNAHPIITAASCTPVNPDSSSTDEPTEPIIRLKLDKPLHWEWELTTSADALPVIQLLDKDGRLLVETTGRTAQRARGSFREGLKSHEEFLPSRSSSEKIPTASSSFSSSSASNAPCPVQGNRNFDGFSTKFGSCSFGYRPRKSKSDVFACTNGGGLLTNKSNEDIARDYFNRVYELLKKRQEEARRIQEGLKVPGREDSSSSNCAEIVQRRRLRRRRKERTPQGKDKNCFDLFRNLVETGGCGGEIRKGDVNEKTGITIILFSKKDRVVLTS